MTYRLGVATDIHLNFLDETAIRDFAKQILSFKLNGLVITGDISEAPYVDTHLAFLDAMLGNNFPIFFVLGNHDYYHGSIAEVRARIGNLFTYNATDKHKKRNKLAWLNSSGVIPLTKSSAIIGHDGWYDGQYDNWFKSRVVMNDYYIIKELSFSYSKDDLFNKINDLSKEAADYITDQAKKAFQKFDHVYIATHIPPFRENTVYNGKISDADWMPHFSSYHMGQALLELCNNNKEKNVTVLCGHTHGFANNKILPNLRCITNEAEYGKPKINMVLNLV